MRSHFSVICVFLVLIVYSSCKESKSSSTMSAGPGQQAALSVEALVAHSQSLSTDIVIPGTLMAFESTEIHPEVAGRLVSLNIREGGNVNKGALLAKLYDGDLQAELRKLEVQLKIAEQTEQRQAELVKIQGISQQEYDISLLQVQMLKADMGIISEEIRKTEIRAPFSGTLGLKNVSPGAYLTPTDILTTISQVNKLKIQFNVPERYSAQIKNGMDVSFTVDGSTKSFTATVLAAEIMIDEATRSLAVRAIVKDKDPALVPGSFAKVHLIPNIAVIPQGRTKQIYLYKSGKAAPTQITTGIRDSTNIEVVSGLKQGDTVIVSSILFLRPGIDVEISKMQ